MQLAKRTPDAREITRIYSYASEVISIVSEKFGKGKKGGYLYVCNEEKITLIHAEIGEIDESARHVNARFSYESARRLLSHPDHKLSSQSRDPKKDCGGGAVRVRGGLILSFCGLSEKLDEIFCPAIARMLGYFEEDRSLIDVLVSSEKYELCFKVLTAIIERPYK